MAFVCNAQELLTNNNQSSKAMAAHKFQLDQFAIYPGCEGKKTVAAQQECFGQAVSKHVNRNFNTDIAKELKIEDIIKMYAVFKISEEGEIIDIKTRAPHPALDEEIKRVLSLIPEIEPATSSGEPIAVSFTLPIVFSI